MSAINNNYATWLNDKLSKERISEILLQKGYDNEAIQNEIILFQKFAKEKRSSYGFVLIAIGAFCGFLSCVLTMLDPLPQLNGLFLYGLTSIAIIIIFGGLYYIFEN